MKHYFSRIFITIMFLLVANTVFAASTTFVSYGEPTYIYLDTKEASFNYDDDGEDIRFFTDNRNNLRLFNKKGTNDYLSFIPYGGINEGVSYTVREVHTKSPSMTFYEIIADRGAKGMNCGYWLIGKCNDKWVTFVSLNSLASMGYTLNEWHHISSNIDNNGRLILTSTHKYMPPGAEYEYQKKTVKDLVVQLFWDSSANWFGLKRI